MIVLDASAVVELVLGLGGHDAVVARMAPDVTVHAPHLLPLEVVQSIRRLVGAGRVPADRGALGVDDVARLDLTLYEHDILLPRIWQLRHNLSAYDASYVALAEVLDSPLLTFDARLAAAPGHGAAIELLRAA